MLSYRKQKTYKLFLINFFIFLFIFPINCFSQNSFLNLNSGTEYFKFKYGERKIIAKNVSDESLKYSVPRFRFSNQIYLKSQNYSVDNLSFKFNKTFSMSSPYYPQSNYSCDKKCKLSYVVFIGGSVLDVTSSIGEQELNPLFRRSDGTFNPYTNTAYKSGLLITSIFLQRKYPEFANKLRRYSGYLYLGVGTRNLIRKGRLSL